MEAKASRKQPSELLLYTVLFVLVMAMATSCEPGNPSITAQQASRARGDLKVALAYLQEMSSILDDFDEEIEVGDQHFVDARRRIRLISERLENVHTLLELGPTTSGAE